MLGQPNTQKNIREVVDKLEKCLAVGLQNNDTARKFVGISAMAMAISARVKSVDFISLSQLLL